MHLGNIQLKLTKSQLAQFKAFWDKATEGKILCCSFGQVSMRKEHIDVMICEEKDGAMLQKAIDRVPKNRVKTMLEAREKNA